MARENEYLKFKLIGNKKPISFELPISSQFMVKRDDKGNNLGKKKIHYIKGAPSIFVEDYKGDEKSKQVFFEDGELKVHRDDKNLVYIVLKHPWNGRKYEQVDEDKKALETLSKNALIKKALNKVDISNEFELKSHGMILIGPHIAPWTASRVKAALENKALNDPKPLLEEMSTGHYKTKYVTSLALLREVLVLNPPRTAILWGDTREVLYNIPAGKDPVSYVGMMLSENTDQVRATLKEIDLKTTRSYVKSYDATVEDEVSDIIGEPKKDVSLDDQELLDVRKKYEENIGNVPNNKKNDIEWLKSKLEDKQ